eukprot:TRINITY_DN29385_c0_g1_i1.p1 TRINITY_DN29385_c0_g1~~TRINITY_DN29385_c0_g1_i1.p1  ORF type:complete len:572 (-),score=136.36 TRINITY_DN29385_c0_g1_i1:132-1847(-)
MQALQTRPDAFTFGAALASCQTQQGSDARCWQRAAELHEEVCRLQIGLSDVMLGSTIGACDRGQRWDLALHALRIARQRGTQLGAGAFNAAAKACVRGASWKHASSLFEERRPLGSLHAELPLGQQAYTPTEATYITALGACSQGGQWLSALEIFEEMVLLRVDAGARGWGAVIDACAEGGAWQWAVHLLNRCRTSELAPNAVLYSSAMAACTRSSRWSWSLHLWDEMLRREVAPDLIAYGALASAYEQARLWQPALSMLRDMAKQRDPARRSRVFAPNAVHYSAVMGACEGARRWQECFELTQDMATKRVMGNEYTAGAAMAVCAKGQRWKWTLQLLEDGAATLVGRGKSGWGRSDSAPAGESAAVRTVEMYGAAATALRHGPSWTWTIAASKLEDMAAAGLQPADPTVHTAVMVACDRGGLWELQLQLLPRMLQQRLPLDRGAYEAALLGCRRGSAEGNAWVAALQLLEDMAAAGKLPGAAEWKAAERACQAAERWPEAEQLLALAQEASQKAARPAAKRPRVRALRAKKDVAAADAEGEEEQDKPPPRRGRGRSKATAADSEDVPLPL